ncbi:MAG UNVERIFIED_CONTAM: hypothetical protein LVR29_10950 [Microcystis novacekii LVE1205-3]
MLNYERAITSYDLATDNPGIIGRGMVSRQRFPGFGAIPKRLYLIIVPPDIRPQDYWSAVSTGCDPTGITAFNRSDRLL